MYCKGSWKDPARNIKYNENILDYELQSMNGIWIQNRIQFFPQY